MTETTERADVGPPPDAQLCKRGEARLVRDSALPWLCTVTANRARTEWRASRRALRLVGRLAPQDERDHADEVAAWPSSRSCRAPNARSPSSACSAT